MNASRDALFLAQAAGVAAHNLPGPAQSEAGVFFSFRVGSLGLLAPASLYCELIAHAQVHALPGAQPWFSGLLNQRGNLIPVIDLRRALGDGRADMQQNKLFILGKAEKAMGLWIEGLPEVCRIDSAPVRQLPALPAALEGYVIDGYTQQGQVWLNLHYDALFKALGRQIALRPA
jgi:chemotaxis signal transduction protein